MTRSIEFRVYSFHDKKFITEECVMRGDGGILRNNELLGLAAIDLHYSTGCYTTDNKLIFNRDIVKITNYSNTLGYDYASVIIGAVHAGTLGPLHLKDICKPSTNYPIRQIVGNIYDTPHLMKELIGQEIEPIRLGS